MSKSKPNRKQPFPPSAAAATPEALAQWLAEAEELRRANRPAKAETLYRRVLAAAEHGAAWRGLGWVNLQAGRPQPALACSDKAAKLGHADPLLHASALRLLGRTAEAADLCRRVLAQQPELPALWNELAADLFLCHDYEAAYAAIREALARQPDSTLALNNLGMIETARYNTDAALEAFRKALALREEDFSAWRNCGLLLLRLRHLDEALECLRRALALRPAAAVLHNDLASALLRNGDFDEAGAHLHEALRLQPGYEDALKNMEQAETLEKTAAPMQAVEPEERRLAMLAELYAMHGRLPETAEIYRQLLARDHISPTTQSNYLMHLHYLPEYTAELSAAAHREWGCRHAAATPRADFPNSPDSERRLRLGYVSPDFRRHSVAYFIEPLLREHDRAQVEVFCYFDHRNPDPVTLRLRQAADVWRDITKLGDNEAESLIRNDGIDLLVDLAAHTGGRMALFSRRPAPVQITYMGYPDTSGVPNIDYRFTDAYADPPGRSDSLHTETLWRLPGCFLCFQPPEGAPAVAPAPVTTGRPLAFGSLNNLSKISDSCVKLWAGALQAAPESRLILKGRAFHDPATRQYHLARFAAAGVAPERITLYPHRAHLAQHLETYHEIDIALDTFPYHGTTTTCEAMWMGVPVVTLAGEPHCAKVGLSLLHAAGLERLIARSPEEFAAIAAALAADTGALAQLRLQLREQLRRSPLLDAPAFTRRLETAYRELWRLWCAGQNRE